MKPKKRNERSFTASTLGKWTTLTVVLVVLLGTASFGFGQGSSLSTWDKGGSSVSSPLSPELSAILAGLKNRSSNQRLDVIVQFKHSPSDSRIQTVKALGGVLRHRLNVIRGALFNLSVNEIRILAKDPEIAYISPNRALDGASDYTEATVGADVAQSYGWDGAGVTVAVIDSGISNRPDRATRSQANRGLYTTRVLFRERMPVTSTDTARTSPAFSPAMERNQAA